MSKNVKKNNYHVLYVLLLIFPNIANRREQLLRTIILTFSKKLMRIGVID